MFILLTNDNLEELKKIVLNNRQITESEVVGKQS